MTDKKYINEKQVSEMTGLALPTLRNDRFLRRRIPYIKVGKAVRYNEAEVIAFMESRRVRTSDDELIRKGGTKNKTALADAAQPGATINRENEYERRN